MIVDDWDPVLEQHKDILFRIFTHFSLQGDPGNISTLTRHKFDKFVRACGLEDDQFTHPQVNVIFSRVCRAETTAGGETVLPQQIRMTFEHFCAALCFIADRKFSDKGAQGLHEMIVQHIAPRVPADLVVVPDVIDDEINALLTLYRKSLEQVYLEP